MGFAPLATPPPPLASVVCGVCFGGGLRIKTTREKPFTVARARGFRAPLAPERITIDGSKPTPTMAPSADGAAAVGGSRTMLVVPGLRPTPGGNTGADDSTAVLRPADATDETVSSWQKTISRLEACVLLVQRAPGDRSPRSFLRDYFCTISALEWRSVQVCGH